jgi:hypothetical protein
MTSCRCLCAFFRAPLQLYDNDYDKEVNWGREFGEKIADKFNLMQIEIEDTTQKTQRFC